MNTPRLHGTHDVHGTPDWVADPPAAARVTRPMLWWGLSPRTLLAGSSVVGGLVVVGLLLWLLLPRPEPVPVPENFFTTHTDSSPETFDTSPVQEAATAFVHVAGEVREPGLVEIPASARVADALELAGGPTADADLAAINLAAPVVDGEQIYLPGHGEHPPAEVGSGRGEPGLINLNTASESELQSLSGIGPVLAARIAADRDTNGPFASVDDLQRVSGIGPALMLTLRSETTV